MLPIASPSDYKHSWNVRAWLNVNVFPLRNRYSSFKTNEECISFSYIATFSQYTRDFIIGVNYVDRDFRIQSIQRFQCQQTVNKCEPVTFDLVATSNIKFIYIETSNIHGLNEKKQKKCDRISVAISWVKQLVNCLAAFITSTFSCVNLRKKALRSYTKDTRKEKVSSFTGEIDAWNERTWDREKKWTITNNGLTWYY